ncbi:MAG: hypothetical protein KF744_06140 [Taibaiella sp.]|nr:hypothetical protein [Taibaiella sp.]
MRRIIAMVFLLMPFIGLSQKSASSPLAKYSSEWNAAKYAVCTTAAQAKYMTEDERTTIYVLNLARMNPKLFCKSVVTPYCEQAGIDMSSEHFYLSLVKRLNEMEPLGLLQPDKACWVSAACYAEIAGNAGRTGHERKNTECEQVKRYNGECCSYGVHGAAAIIVDLLVDEGVQSLGHREILLTEYRKIGVATRPHKKYGTNTVLDLVF